MESRIRQIAVGLNTKVCVAFGGASVAVACSEDRKRDACATTSPAHEGASEKKEERDERNSGRTSREEVTMAHIKSEFPVSRDVYFPGQDSLGKGVAGIIL